MDDAAHMLLSSSVAAQDGKYVSDDEAWGDWPNLDPGVAQSKSVVTDRGVSNTVGAPPSTGVVSAVSKFTAPG